jgi:hypothetical protein
MLKLGGASQAAQASMLAGQSFTIGKTVMAGDGIANWLFLHPVNATGAAAGEGMVALKLEGARQAGQLSTMVGQTVTIGKAPVGGAAASKWLVLHPFLGGGTAAKGAVGAGVALKSGGAMKTVALQAMETEVEQAAAQKAIAAGAAKGMTGTTGATAAGKGVLSTGSLMGKAGTAGTMAGKGAMAGAAGTTAVTTTTTTGAVAGAKAAAAASVKGAVTGGSAMGGAAGTSLGVGLGLGVWGTLLLVAATAAAGVGIYSYMRKAAPESGVVDDGMSLEDME